MQLVAVGLNHSSAPLSVRERLAVVPDRMGEALAELATAVHEGFILSTCNRTELYAISGHADSGAQVLSGFLQRRHGGAPESLAPHLYTRSHADAAGHLFRVASGLDSMVLGEDQIVAQVKAALAAAQAAGTLGPRLHRLGAAALAASKQVRAETAIGRSATSVVSVALAAAEQEFGSLGDRSVVVVGAGRTAESVIRHCVSLAPTASVTIVNRTPSRGLGLAARFGVQAAPWQRLGEAVAGADLLVTATSAPSAVVGMAEMSVPRSAGRRLVCLDLSVPRGIDPAAAALPSVVVHDVDRLRDVADANRRRREMEIAPADAIVAEHVAQFMAWWRGREVAPAIERLRARADAIREAELERALARLPQLADADQAVVRELAARLTNKFLHHPMTNLRHDPEAANLATALDRLFTPAAS